MVEILCDQNNFEKAISDGKIVLGNALLVENLKDLSFDPENAVPLKGKRASEFDVNLNRVEPVRNNLRRRNPESESSVSESEGDNPVFHGHVVKVKCDG